MIDILHSTQNCASTQSSSIQLAHLVDVEQAYNFFDVRKYRMTLCITNGVVVCFFKMQEFLFFVWKIKMFFVSFLAEMLLTKIRLDPKCVFFFSSVFRIFFSIYICGIVRVWYPHTHLGYASPYTFRIYEMQIEHSKLSWVPPNSLINIH